MIRRSLVLFAFLPLFASAEFDSRDSQALHAIDSSAVSIDSHLNSLEQKVYSVNGNVEDIEGDVSALRHALLTQYSSQYNASALYWIWSGSRAVYNFLSANNQFDMARRSVRLDAGVPVKSTDLVSLTGNPLGVFGSILESLGLENAESLYSIASLQKSANDSLSSVDKNISSITNFLDTPVFNSGTSQTYEYDHLDPSSASMDNAPVVSTSTIQFTGGQNFIKWFGNYSKQIFQGVGRLNSSLVKQQYRIWDLQQKTASVTNIADGILQYDIAQSNLLHQIVSDNKKSSDSFSNLWVSTFAFPMPSANVSFPYYSLMSGNPFNYSLENARDRVPDYKAYATLYSDSSLTKLLYDGFNGLLTFRVNDSKYFYSYQLNLIDIRDKLANLPSAISSALSGLHVNVDNTVSVSGGGSPSSTNTLSWAYDKNAMLVWFGQQLEVGPVLDDLEPSADLDVSSSNLALAGGGLTGNLNQDLPYLLSWVIRQNANNNTGVFSILTNLQMIVGSQVSEDTSQSEDEFSSFVSDTTANYEHLVTEIQSVRDNPHTFNVDEHRQAWAGFVSSGGPLGFLANAARWNDEVVLDLMFMHTGSSAVPGGFDWGSVSGHNLYYRLDISKYKWFFDLMRCVSILGVWWLTFKLILFFLRLYIKLFKFSYKVYTSLIGGGS